MELNLKGDWILITGATSGIGHEMAKIYASKGQNMILVSRNEEKLCQIARELNEESDVIIMPVDLSVTGSAKVLFDECERLKLNIHVLINNAGFGKFGESTMMSHKDVESMLTLNVTTLTTLSKLFGAKMRSKGRGYILNVSSTAAFQSIPYLSAYSASKTYVQYFTNALREELKPHGVRVSGLYPGPTDTKFFDVAFENKDADLFKKQPMMPASEVAAIAIEGMEKGRKSIVPGSLNKVISNSAGFVPPSAIAHIIRKYSRN
jgi:short-subunit dehydrogenase